MCLKNTPTHPARGKKAKCDIGRPVRFKRKARAPGLDWDSNPGRLVQRLCSDHDTTPPYYITIFSTFQQYSLKLYGIQLTLYRKYTAYEFNLSIDRRHHPCRVWLVFLQARAATTPRIPRIIARHNGSPYRPPFTFSTVETNRQVYYCDG